MSDIITLPANDWNRLRRQIFWLRIGVLLALLSSIALMYASFVRDTQIVRTHGLVIVDAQGRDRIILGAPVPASADRKRNDDGGHTTSIFFLGGDGSDRLAIGQMPGLQNGHRIGDGDDYGMMLYDKTGHERGGMGFNSGAGRAIVALDRARPSADAIGLLVDDKSGFAGLLVNYAQDANDFAIKIGTSGNEALMNLYGKQGLSRAMLKVADSDKPEWKLDGATPETNQR